MSEPKYSRPEILQILTQLPLFQQLSPEQVAPIADAVRERSIGKGEILFHKGDAPKGFFVVITGQIKLAFPSAKGNEKVVQIIGPRQSFGEAVMFLDRPYPVFAEALGDTLLLHIGRDAVVTQLAADPLLAMRLLAGLALRLHSLVQDVETYSLRSSAQRVIGYLLQQCSPEVDGSSEQEIALPTSKQVIASRLNLTPETLSRIFHDLADSGLITVHGKHITIHDLCKLREFDL